MRGIKYYIVGAVLAVGAFVGYNNFYSNADARDCSTNSVIKCGTYSIGELRDAYNTDKTPGTKNIYEYFGLTSSIINDGRVVNGLVHKSGIVTVGGKTVATDALTAGRENMSGSTKVTYKGTTFYTRTPSVSFLSSSLEAYVFTDGQGRFLGAVIKDCGNPVKGKNTVTPPSNPKVAIEKKVLTDRSLADPKEHGIVGEDNPFAYRVTVTNTGDVTLKNAVVTDPAPKGVTFTSADKGSVKSNVWTYTIPELKPGASVTALIHAVAKEQFLTEVENIACVDAKEISGTKDACDNAWVRTHDRKVTIEKTVNGGEHATVEVGKPFTYTLVVTNHGDVALSDVYVYDKAPDGVAFLDADKGTIKDNKWSMTIKSLVVKESVTIKITAKATKQLTGTKNTACVNAPITEENPDDCDDATIDTPAPVYACKNLAVDKISRTEFKFTATREVKNAEYLNTVFEVRDDKGTVVATINDEDGVATFTRTNPGTYTVRATVRVKVNGEVKTVTSDNCVKSFTVDKPPVVPVYACKDLSVKKISRTEFTFTATREVKDAEYVRTVFQVRNSSDAVVATINDADGVLDYAQKTTGTYTVRASIVVRVNGEVKTVTSDNCAKSFTVDKPPVVDKPGVKIEKTVNGKETVEVALNTPFTYEITVTNTGNTDLSKVTVSDKAPAGVVFLRADAGVVAANGSSWNAVVDLKKGEHTTFTITAKLTVRSDDAIRNVACVDAPQVPNTPNTAADDCDDAFVTTPEQPSVEKVKACNTKTGEIELVEKGKENVAPYTSDLSKCDKVAMCPIPGKENLPATDPDCKKDTAMCDVDGKENLPANDPACKEEPAKETPNELPHTGVSGAVASILALGGLTAAAAYAINGRRNS